MSAAQTAAGGSFTSAAPRQAAIVRFSWSADTSFDVKHIWAMPYGVVEFCAVQYVAQESHKGQDDLRWPRPIRGNPMRLVSISLLEDHTERWSFECECCSHLDYVIVSS